MSTLHFKEPIWQALRNDDHTVFGPTHDRDTPVVTKSDIDSAIAAINVLNDAVQAGNGWKVTTNTDDKSTIKEKIEVHNETDVNMPYRKRAETEPLRGRLPRSGAENKLQELCRSEGFITDGRMLMGHQWDNMVRFFHESTLDITAARQDAASVDDKATKSNVVSVGCSRALAAVEAEALRMKKDTSISYSGLPPYGVLVTDVPGLGKTTTGLMCGLLARAVSRAKGGPTCILAVVPPTLISQWQAEVETLFGWGERNVVVYSADMEESDLNGADMVIVSRFLLSNMLKSVWTKPSSKKPFHRSGDPEHAGWVPLEPLVHHPIFHGSWAALIVDESHTYRNAETQGAIAIAALGAASNVRVLLTGTPHVNFLKDLATQMKLAGGRPELHTVPSSAADYSQKLYERAQRTSMVGHQKSILKLPPLHEVVVRVPMSSEDKLAVKKAASACSTVVKGLKNDSDAAAPNTLHAINLLRYASTARPLYEYSSLQSWQLKRVGKRLIIDDNAEFDGSSKNNEDMVREFQADAIVANPSLKLKIAVRIAQQASLNNRKTIMFSQSLALLYAMKRLVNNALGGENRAELFVGSTTKARRKELVRQPKNGDEGGLLFSDPKLRVLLCSTTVAGLGLNLAPAADVCVILDCWWNPATDRQAIDRIHRLGAVSQCDVYTLVNQLSSEDVIRTHYHTLKDENKDRIMDVDAFNSDEVQEKPSAKLLQEVVRIIEQGFADDDIRRAYVHGADDVPLVPEEPDKMPDVDQDELDQQEEDRLKAIMEEKSRKLKEQLDAAAKAARDKAAAEAARARAEHLEQLRDEARAAKRKHEDLVKQHAASNFDEIYDDLKKQLAENVARVKRLRQESLDSKRAWDAGEAARAAGYKQQ